MPDYVDVLDHTGRTPREFGSIHIHVEPVVRGPSGEAVATVWLQRAFEPRVSGESVLVLSGPEEHHLGRFPLPSVDGGQVVRWSLPLTLPAGVTELHFLVESQLHPKAQRVRPAWKLFDTFEIPKDAVNTPAVSARFDVAQSVVGSLLNGSLSLSFETQTSITEATGGRRHAARKLPPAFIAQVTEGTPERLDAPRAEVLWAPGQPLPGSAFEAAWNPVAAPARSDLRICYSCGFEGPEAEYGRARFCPRCDATWD